MPALWLSPTLSLGLCMCGDGAKKKRTPPPSLCRAAPPFGTPAPRRGRLRRSRGGAAPPSLPALSSWAEAASQNGAAPSRGAPGVKMAAAAPPPSPSFPVALRGDGGWQRRVAGRPGNGKGAAVAVGGGRWAPRGCGSGSLGCPWALTCVRPAGGAGGVPLRQPSPGAPGVAGEACGVLPPPQDGILRPGAGAMLTTGGFPRCGRNWGGNGGFYGAASSPHARIPPGTPSEGRGLGTPRAAR